jgi:Flp pilus assembly protein TadG
LTIKNSRKESGQTLVEFALVIPVLLLLIFGIIEGAIMYNTQITITNAAREGARKAAVTSDAGDVRITIENSLKSLGVTVPLLADSTAKDNSEPDEGTVQWYIEGSGKGNPVTVYVKGRVDIVVPIISSLIGEVLVIPAKAEMMIEYE